MQRRDLLRGMGLAIFAPMFGRWFQQGSGRLYVPETRVVTADEDPRLRLWSVPIEVGPLVAGPRLVGVSERVYPWRAYRWRSSFRVTVQ